MARGRLLFRDARNAIALRMALAAALLLGAAPGADAFEAFNGRVAANGYFESQFRAINRDYSEDWDATQWYMIFNLEIELDLVQDTVGPIDLLSAFIRAEVRYDCIYSRGCGMFRSMDAYGDRSKSLPRRLHETDRVRHSGRIRIPEDPERPEQWREFTTEVRDSQGNVIRKGGTNTDPVTAVNDPTLSLFANGAGGDGITPLDAFLDPINRGCEGDAAAQALCTYYAGGDGTTTNFDISQLWPDNDNPFRLLARDGGYSDIRTSPKIGGPWLPKNKFVSNAANSNTPNPWDSRVGSYNLQASAYNAELIRLNQLAIDNSTPFFDSSGNVIDEAGLEAAIAASTALGLSTTGAGELPYRPAPLAREDGARDPSGNLIDQATRPGDPRGVFVPSKPLADRLNKGDLRGLEGDYNFSENQRAFNRGASQKDEKELKEAYLDIEMFDNRLWLRVGKQQIVWGKTELFRTTDQFNPTDQSLASLPSLEESRIALWSLRGVWSFYEVGPIDDVRLEIAVNFDDFEQIDLGACGEPYAVNVTCQLTFGAFAHSIFGVGLAGVESPPDPWQSWKGWEFGARLEWRYDRFSFALSDYYGYDDLPVIETLSTYTRNVDPVSGRPRSIFAVLPTTRRFDPYANARDDRIEQVGTQGVCLNGDEESCLQPKFVYDDSGNPTGPANTDALRNAATAQQLFAYTCAGTVGFSSLDAAACALNIFGSEEVIPGAIPIRVSRGLGAILAGSPTVNGALAGAAGGFIFPLVRLNVDPNDLNFDTAGEGPGNPNVNGGTTGCRNKNGDPCGGQGAPSSLIPLPGIGTTFNTFPGGQVVVAETLGGTLSPEQEALLGCGPFWGTQCDDDGVDLLNAEGSALFQSWPGVEGTVRNGNIQDLWYTNQKVVNDAGIEVFANQPGTRNWYFDETREHAVGPVCSTGNFGGAIFREEAAEIENDRPNGNQAVLPGCRRKWKTNPDFAVNADQRLLALNIYGQDLRCARAIINERNGQIPAIPSDCFVDVGGSQVQLGDFDSPRVDPRSWERVKDGDPDNLNMQHINFGLTVQNRTVFLPPSRDVGGQQVVAPDFFYTAPTFFGPVFGAPFDNCDTAAYPQALIDEYGGAQFVPCARGGHPMTGQPWSSEIAAVSWNFLVLLVQQERQVVYDDLIEDCATASPQDPALCALSDYEKARAVFLDPDDCSLVNVALCDTFRTLQGSIGLQRNIRRAGGNGTHGRRTFAWQSGGEAIITYNKRNVLGFSMDFAEDTTKANFNLEFTWIEGVVVSDSLQYDGTSKTDEFNLSFSVDRPTFINFLNANRTFFFNWQFFARYRSSWRKGYTDEGPWNFVTTFAIATAYFQDRLAPSLTSVYDIRTQSGALLPSISYRFTQNFSAAVGMAFFFGKPDQTDEALAGLAPASNRSDRSLQDLYKIDREGGLAIVRDRDEVWLRIRYAF